MDVSVRSALDRAVSDYAERKKLTDQEANVLADRLLKVLQAKARDFMPNVI